MMFDGILAIGVPCTSPRDCLDAVTGIPGDIAGSVAGGVIEELAEAVTEAVGKAVASVGTLWVKVGTPNLTTTNGGTTPSDAVGFLQGSLFWYMTVAAVVAVIVAGGKMAWEQRAQPGRDLVKGLLTLVIVSGAGLTAISLATVAADGFARWIIDNSLEDGDFGKNITIMLGLTAVSGLGAIIVIVLGLAAFMASLIQIALMVVRGGMLVILAGILPLSAAATSTEWGRSWFKKCIAWLIAFILYKPAAAIVYATAFRLTGSDVFGGDSDELMAAVTGLVLMVLALVALPALMRFVTPMVGAVASGGGGGGGTMAAGAAMAAMPTGAMRVAGGSSNGGGGATAGSPGGAGPAGMAGGAGPGGRNGSSPGGGSANGGGAKNGGGAPVPASQGAGGAGAASAGGGGAAAGGGAATAGGGAASGAAAAAGPAGMAAAAGAQAAAGAAKGAKNAAQGAAESQTQSEDEGPRGSR